jgi:hypothetical protein
MEPKPSAHPAIKTRLVLLGASNLTWALPLVVSLAKNIWPQGIEIFGALGYGRSYGTTSRILGRALPGILQSGLWKTLDHADSRPTYAIMTDIGNDILYGISPFKVLEWIAECIKRFRNLGAEIVITDLPIANMKDLSRRRFLLYRSILVPSCSLSLSETCKRALIVSKGLQDLTCSKRIVLISPQSEWYRFDPIHFRLSQWKTAWYKILTGGKGECLKAKIPFINPLAWLQTHSARSENQWWLGVKTSRSQPSLKIGVNPIWLY